MRFVSSQGCIKLSKTVPWNTATRGILHLCRLPTGDTADCQSALRELVAALVSSAEAI